MSRPIPPTLAWARSFAECINSILEGDLYGWEAIPRTDPLQWIIHLRFKKPIIRETIPSIREILKDWAQANDSEYRRSEYNKYSFKALVILKALGPEKNIHPWGDE